MEPVKTSSSITPTAFYLAYIKCPSPYNKQTVVKTRAGRQSLKYSIHLNMRFLVVILAMSKFLTDSKSLCLYSVTCTPQYYTLICSYLFVIWSNELYVICFLLVAVFIAIEGRERDCNKKCDEYDPICVEFDQGNTATYNSVCHLEVKTCMDNSSMNI